jgi:hypothetical protein
MVLLDLKGDGALFLGFKRFHFMQRLIQFKVFQGGGQVDDLFFSSTVLVWLIACTNHNIRNGSLFLDLNTFY